MVGLTKGARHVAVGNVSGGGSSDLANGRLYVALKNGEIVCLAGE